MAIKEHKKVDSKSVVRIQKTEDFEIFGLFGGGAYEARIYTLLSEHVEMKGGYIFCAHPRQSFSNLCFRYALRSSFPAE